MPGWPRALAIAMMLWWGFFGSISLSWALGSPWLVDTVLQGNGLRLAQERPTWFVVVVFISGLVKLGHPHPESYFWSLLNSTAPHTTQR